MHALYTDAWLAKLQTMYSVESAISVCNNRNSRLLNACKASQAFKFEQVLRFLKIINASSVLESSMNVVKALFGSCITWENFVANRGQLMQTYVKNCICYRDYLDCNTGEPQIANLPPNASFASATSAVADAGIIVQLVELLEALTALKSDHRLIIVLIIAIYQQLFLDYNSSYLGQYSTYYPIDKRRNPAFLATSIGGGAAIINTFVPNYLWYLLAYDLHLLQTTGTPAPPDKQWDEYFDVVTPSTVRQAITHLGLAPSVKAHTKSELLQALRALVSALDSEPFSRYRDSNGYQGCVESVILRTNKVAASGANSPAFVLEDLMPILSSELVMSGFRTVLEIIIGKDVPDVSYPLPAAVRAYNNTMDGHRVCHDIV